MKFEEFVGSNERNLMKQESLLEMARVDDPHNMPFKNKKSVWVYSDDRNKMTPHFHYYLDGSKKIYLEISISELKIIFSTPRKGVSDNKLLTWSELSKEKDELREWLQRQNTDYPGFTNYIVLVKTWNQNNRDNQIDVSKLDLDIAIKTLYRLEESYDMLYEMANLSQRRTGINTRISISSKEGQHGPKIKVYNSSNDECFSMSIEDSPKVLIGNPNIVSDKILKQTIKWVQINKNVLLYYWQHPDMDIDDLLDRIKKIWY